MRPILFNGKFLTADPTGVHRVAEELIQALDRLLAPLDGGEGIPPTAVLAPTTARRHPVLSRTPVIAKGLLSTLAKGIAWEQFTLPWLARKGVLVSLCNLGPVLHPHAVTMIHDAQVYLTPRSYSKGFRLWYRFLQPLIGRTSRRILAVSHYSKEQLVLHGVAPADKITVIHNGCDHILACRPDHGFVAASGLQSGRYVLSLANTQAHKNIPILFEAFRDGRLGDLTLVLFGGASRDDFERLGARVPPNVRFVGRIDDEKVAALMIHARAFACPSTTEGFGLPPLEAMILGCPAIVAPCGALPEVCANAALTADPHDAGRWVEQIRALTDDAALAERMRAEGRKHAAAFTWENAARKLAQVLDIPIPEKRYSQPVQEKRRAAG
ncbi:glycosyltransferase family 4 protein [Shinella sp. BYT-45]|uniref:glycosyltransferase family 4 protein n=1 Tax=Shinella sp. BYT-45 TaxID=3377377 RepID=UPI0039816F00